MTEGFSNSEVWDLAWREILCAIVAESVAREIALELLVPDRIDPRAFLWNWDKMQGDGLGGRASFEAALFPDEVQNFSTLSIQEASSPLNHIAAFPDWFVAAYPDVFLWFIRVQEEYVRDRSPDKTVDDVMEDLLSDLFDLGSGDELRLDQVFDSERKWLPRRLAVLISKYRQRTKKHPEASVYETGNREVMEIYGMTQ